MEENKFGCSSYHILQRGEQSRLKDGIPVLNTNFGVGRFMRLINNDSDDYVNYVWKYC
jgi:hypothetical protein